MGRMRHKSLGIDGRPLKIGVILDATELALWQAEALLRIANDAEFIIYSCTTAAPVRRERRHALYYLLNLFTVRNRLSRRVGLPRALNIVSTRTFAAPCEGAWQSLPNELLDTIASDRPNVLVKFGMGLLKIPPPDQLAVPILSYHHGDPSKFRGRPAGFHELLRGEATVGQVVQILSSALDSGTIVASAETAAIRHSYRETLIEAYRQSPLLLGPAIHNALQNRGRHPPEFGPAYRLPDNLTVLRFVAQRLQAAVARSIYGLTREKRWSIATAEMPNARSLGSIVETLAGAKLEAFARPPNYRFLADPFFRPDGSLLAEAMRTTSARGEIINLTNGIFSRISGRGGHFSYPSVLAENGSTFVVPEVSDWSPTLAFPLIDGRLAEPFELQIPGRPRLLDPTPFLHGGTVYLFGNIAAEGSSVLRLWMASALSDTFAEHPASPIRISPNGARMAGAPLVLDGELIRVGQDLRRNYGDGIAFFRIIELDRKAYAEECAGGFRFSDRRGPHTLNLNSGTQIAFDFYEDAFSLLAGVHRFKERRAARQISD